MERFDVVKKINNQKGCFKNGIVMPILAFLSELYDSEVVLSLQEEFSELSHDQIFKNLGLERKDYKDILEYVLIKIIEVGVSEVSMLALDPLLAKEVLKSLGLSGTVYVRGKALKPFSEKIKNEKENDINVRFGAFVDPYYDDDHLLEYVSSFCAQNKMPVMTVLYDDLEKSGELNVRHKKSPIEFIESIGLLDRELFILGGSYADKEDFALMSSYGAKMVICPYESLNFGKGCPNLFAMLNSKVEVEIASPIICDMFKEFEFASVVSRGMLNDEKVLPVFEVSKLGLSSKSPPKLSEERFFKAKEKIEKIKNKIKEKI